MSIYDFTELIVNNSQCAILKVKDGHQQDLIALGIFDGDETMFRLTKGKIVTCTVFYKEREPYSWQWGGHGGETIVDQSTKIKGRLIQYCFETEHDIKCQF
ncbi:MAG: hypothetical protein IKN43_02130 [Selenomonadaceae bacterium]|nr:hypothetical protein [Selenomonadaceae bacterium]